MAEVEGRREHIGRAHAQPCQGLCVHASDSVGRVTQSFAIGVFPDRDQEFAHRGSGTVVIERTRHDSSREIDPVDH